MAVDPLPETLTQNPLRVLVVDAHPAVGLGLVRLVGLMPGVAICGLSASGTDGVECAGQLHPDVALVDAELPGDAAPLTIRALRACLPRTRIVALGLYPGRRASMLAAGAHAFILKDAGFEVLRAAIVAGPVCGSSCESASALTPGSAHR